MPKHIVILNNYKNMPLRVSYACCVGIAIVKSENAVSHYATSSYHRFCQIYVPHPLCIKVGGNAFSYDKLFKE